MFNIVNIVTIHKPHCTVPPKWLNNISALLYVIIATLMEFPREISQYIAHSRDAQKLTAMQMTNAYHGKSKDSTVYTDQLLDLFRLCAFDLYEIVRFESNSFLFFF